MLGFFELSRGRAPEAHAVADAGARGRAASSRVGEPAVLRFIPDAVEALLSLDRPAEADAVLAVFEGPRAGSGTRGRSPRRIAAAG